MDALELALITYGIFGYSIPLLFQMEEKKAIVFMVAPVISLVLGIILILTKSYY